MKKVLIVVVAIFFISMISTFIARTYITANENNLSYTIDLMPQIGEVEAKNSSELGLHKISVISKFIILNLVISIAIIMLLYKTKVFQKRYIDLLISILILVIPNILLYINTSDLLNNLIKAVY